MINVLVTKLFVIGGVFLDVCSLFNLLLFAFLISDCYLKRLTLIIPHSMITANAKAKMGPHRDTTGELGKAVRAAGLHFGVSSPRVEHNLFLGVGRRIPSDVNDPQYAAFYGPAHNWSSPPSGVPLNDDFTYVSPAWADDCLARGVELVEKYHPDIVYFDWWIGQASMLPNLTNVRGLNVYHLRAKEQ